MSITGQAIMDSLYAKIAGDPKMQSNIHGSIKFMLHGSSGGVWILSGGTSPSLDTRLRDTDCTIETDVETMAAIERGALSAQVAFLANDLKVSGSAQHCLDLVHLWS